MASKKSAQKFENASQLIQRAVELRYFSEKSPAIPYHWVRGSNPLIVIVGDNAGGKSFVRRIFNALCQKNHIEFMGISMEGRQGVSMAPWLALVYGDESYQSTGQLSVSTVLGGIKTCTSRCEERKPHVIFWDEPDLGLSESWAAGVGVAIRDLTQQVTSSTRAICVVTHSRPLVRELLPVNPHYLHVGSDKAPATLKEWLTRKVRPRKIETLGKLSHQRFTKIRKILKECES